MRLFLAIDLPKSAKKSLAKQLEKIQKEHASFRWVSAENYHLTLQFFGEDFDSQKIIKAVEESIFDLFETNLYSTDVDLFINSKIVIYLNFRREKMLETLIERIRDNLRIKTTKKFIPHLSLARLRIPSKQQYFALKKRLANLDLDLEFPVKNIYLFDSVIKNGKPLYKKIYEFSLLS